MDKKIVSILKGLGDFITYFHEFWNHEILVFFNKVEDMFIIQVSSRRRAS